MRKVTLNLDVVFDVDTGEHIKTKEEEFKPPHDSGEVGGYVDTEVTTQISEATDDLCASIEGIAGVTEVRILSSNARFEED
jgi:hypothetical protein